MLDTKTMNYKLYILFSLLIISLMSCRDLKELSVSNVEGFQVNKMNARGIEADIMLKVKNPNNVGFTIYPSEFDITYSGVRLGKAKLDKHVKIAKSCERVYTFKLNSNFSELNPMDALKLLTGKNANTIEVNGDLKAGKFLMRKKFPVNYHEKVNIFN